jgi:hypothetical protein
LAAAARIAAVVQIKVWLVINSAQAFLKSNDMKASNRDLLVLMRNENSNEQFMEHEVELLNDLLFQYETLDNFCIAHEVFDLNRYKIHRKQEAVQQITRQRKLHPFQFLCNKN